MKINLLTWKTSKHFSIHPSRQKTLETMIFDVLSTKNVQHQSLAREGDSLNPKAAWRKVERFFVKNFWPSKIMQNLFVNLKKVFIFFYNL